ncbi:hypothetical protein QE152_g19565 [Popillia japonica]|uniref:Uncharacterized protein n=1 Tax=Popillia japonica TaxID=7064 RepID=A0AAW1KSP1_POPJA
MAPLRTFYSQKVKTWLRTNAARLVTQYQICALLGQAYNRPASIQTAASRFRKIEIYLDDRNVFDEVDFALAETTERAQQAANATFEAIPEEKQDHIPQKMTTKISKSSSPEAEPFGKRTIETFTNVDGTESDVNFSKSNRELTNHLVVEDSPPVTQFY